MNILVLGNKFGSFGGAELLVYQIGLALHQSGQKVELAGINMTRREALFAELAIPVRTYRPENRFLRALSKRARRWLGYLPTRINIRRRMGRCNLIIVGHVNLLPLAHRLRRPGERVVLVALGIEIWSKWGEELAAHIEACDLIVAISSFTRQKVIEQIEERHWDKVVVVAPAVDTDYFLPGDQDAFAGVTNIISVARLSAAEQYKGHDLVIEALARIIPGASQRIEYHVYGEGDDRGRLESLVNTKGLAGKVFFHGRASSDELLKAYQGCDIFALPSFVLERPDGSWAGEGFGIVYAEAAACGKPCLAADVGGQTDIVRDGVNGVSVKPTIEGVRAGLERLINDPTLARRMGEAGRLIVEREFALEHFQKNWNDLTVRLCAE